ncbi:MAG: hypothetical protein JO250_15700 [Armatimonadetes bacterium]|nr:hypothetical protein [Armatimonadota bacterium]
MPDDKRAPVADDGNTTNPDAMNPSLRRDQSYDDYPVAADPDAEGEVVDSSEFAGMAEEAIRQRMEEPEGETAEGDSGEAADEAGGESSAGG